MDFSFSEEHEMIRDMCRDFAENELMPIAAELDKTGRFPEELIKKAGELGLMGTTVPEEYGGAGMDTTAYVIAGEELCRACPATGIIIGAHLSLVTMPIYHYGTEEQRQKYVTPMAKGEKLGCLGLTEPDAGSDAGNLKTTAKLEGDHYIVNGTKQFITNAAEADICLLMVQTNKDRGQRGLSALIVEMDTPGFTVGKHEEKMGIRATSTCSLTFENMKVPAENLLGKEGQGFRIAMWTLDGGRISVAAQALGICRAALEKAVQYSKERVQFGKPISSFQSIQWMLANMATEIESVRWLTYYTAWLKDQGLPYGKFAAMAKLKGSEVSNFVCNKALQIHGGYGYTMDYDLERHLRDARITEIYEGTSEIQRLVIARFLLKE
jgi:alkylation response protein AidB-like acyl-CoA dehydrogenase